jgi:mannose-6-phosphate isomerase-like protein (cupin superfamily)
MATPARTPRLLHPGQPRSGKPLNILGDTIISLVTGDDNADALSMAEIRTPPGGGTPLHVHRREDEYFFILEGDVEFDVNGLAVRATPGAYVFAPRNVPHRYVNVGEVPSRMIGMAQPAGIEKMFEEMHAVAAAGAPALQELSALCERYGIEILGPPPGHM